MKLRSNQLLVSDDGDIIMGKGRMEILESIDRTGSINQTSKEMKMSYKTVWSKIKSTEKNFGKPVVHADKKTGTKLTDDGRTLLEKYRKLKKRCIQADDTIFNDIFLD
ncbi:MAG: LysR family transcriptional regulator [Desulfobacterales bacterium]|nr:LysR family transcriptional regulator [Desulfobacterales bacterium]MBU8911196.1 LysR family transcriptional regulator [Desulfobacterales bacterium]